MPYVLSNGEMADKQPWGIAKIVAMFWGILNFFFMFFRTLISPGSHARGDQYTQDFRGPGGGGSVHHVTSDADMAAQLKRAGSKLVVVDFFATWCGPCRMIAPYVEQMAAETPNVVFLKVDVNQCDGVAAQYSVRAMPTFVFIKNGHKVDSFSGADIERLRVFVYRHC
ncbi:thioredoxin-2-like [Homalodisca vitripennis]|uniref:thioredoxin-2-like n=1 Tax=Homalodisca vitripennis TaxID=197043 RepID=UPI001EEA4677|nr:thioredoxin-2-like [Homalodisca vitripennis]